jgi:hypothetical protein
MSHRLAAITIGIVTLGATRVAFAQVLPTDAPVLRVFMMNEAPVPPETLSSIEEEVGSVYAAAGVQVVWLHPVPDAPTDWQMIDVAVKIARGLGGPIMAALDDDVLGFAAVNLEHPEHRGRIVWVFYDQIEKYTEWYHTQVDRLSAKVVAHEIGHLFLPAGHSESGLMRARWDLHLDLLDYFTPEQAKMIRARIRSEGPKIMVIKPR